MPNDVGYMTWSISVRDEKKNSDYRYYIHLLTIYILISYNSQVNIWHGDYYISVN